jgi:hypothetical protein
MPHFMECLNFTPSEGVFWWHEERKEWEPLLWLTQDGRMWKRYEVSNPSELPERHKESAARLLKIRMIRQIFNAGGIK